MIHTQQVSATNREQERLWPGFRFVPLLVVLLIGAFLAFALADRTLQGDPYEWLRTAQRLYLTGDTGFQHRNILYSYVLAIPLVLHVDPVEFGLYFSGISLLLTALLIYRINRWHVSPLLAAYVSLLLIVSYPFLRYGTQLFSDIPAVLFIAAMLYFHFRFLRSHRPTDLLLGYFMASAAVSMRYASGFFFLAFLYYIWVTRKYFRWHLIGLLVAVIPYIPQLIYNVRQMGNPVAISYTSVHPIFGLQFFFSDLGSGHRYQLPGYLRYMFFDFRGLFVLLTPVAAFGALRSFRRLGSAIALYLVLYLVGFVVLLPFYSYFSNRYAIPALIPCFVWLAIGFSEIWRRLRQAGPGWRAISLAALALVAYGMFEISFQVIESSRMLHELRDRVFSEADRLVKDGDVVYTLPSVTSFVARTTAAHPKVLGVEDLTPDLLDQYPGRSSYVVWTPDLSTSEGGSWYLSIAKVRGRLTPVYSTESEDVTELLLYRALRLLGKAEIIPHEKWTIFQVVKN